MILMQLMILVIFKINMYFLNKSMIFLLLYIHAITHLLIMSITDIVVGQMDVVTTAGKCWTKLRTRSFFKSE